MSRKKKRGRRVGTSGTRTHILSAATARFAAHGYDGVTVRTIAADCGVDAALVHHYFGAKRDLFAATLALPPDVSAYVREAVTGTSPGEAIVRQFLESWDDAVNGSGFAALMRTSSSDPAAQRRLADIIAATIVAPAAGAIDAKSSLPKLRAALVAAQISGLAWMRYVLRAEPLASASPQLLARTYGPSINATLALT
jgi:AcrR family transcriptional regulator